MALFFMQLHKVLKRASHSIGLHEHKTPVLSGQPFESQDITCKADVLMEYALRNSGSGMPNKPC
jgi:hypothetical protein